MNNSLNPAPMQGRGMNSSLWRKKCPIICVCILKLWQQYYNICMDINSSPTESCSVCLRQNFIFPYWTSRLTRVIFFFLFEEYCVSSPLFWDFQQWSCMRGWPFYIFFKSKVITHYLYVVIKTKSILSPTLPPWFRSASALLPCVLSSALILTSGGFLAFLKTQP